MMAANDFGLSRDIPEPVKREVRQRDGFGCIVCGSAYYQYDHLGTEFVAAREHDPAQIVLLCGGCHDRKTRGALSTETLQRHAQSPCCRQDGFSRGPLDIGVQHPEIVLGTIFATRVRSLLTVDGQDLLSIQPPDEPGKPFTVSASLFDNGGQPILKIVDNEFQAQATNWDTEIVGQRITIRSAPGQFSLVMRSEPPHRLVIERLNMVYRGTAIQCREGQPTVIRHGGNELYAGGATVIGCDIAIRFDQAGLAIGVGGGMVGIDRLVINPTSTARPVRAPVMPVRRAQAKQGRNEPCACGSGKKYKHCHGRV